MSDESSNPIDQAKTASTIVPQESDIREIPHLINPDLEPIEEAEKKVDTFIFEARVAKLEADISATKPEEQADFLWIKTHGLRIAKLEADIKAIADHIRRSFPHLPV